MALIQSTRRSSGAKVSKPDKPYPAFPLFAHACGKWAKKHRGRLIYFGRWDDPQGALREYREWANGGRPSVAEAGSPTVKQAVNAFLAAKNLKVSSGELAKRTFTSYVSNDNLITREFTRLLRQLKIDRPGQSFYLLRHHFSDWAQELGDNDAVDVLMGHANESIRLNYRHHFPDARLLRVTEHVRAHGPAHRDPSFTRDRDPRRASRHSSAARPAGQA